MGFQYYSEAFLNSSDLLMSLDKLISERAVKSMFVTALYAQIDSRKMTMSYANSGHCFPIIYGDGRHDVIELSSVGRPLGLSFGLVPEELSVKLQSGDRILIYTDGIIETLNDSDEEYGEDRLMDFLRSNYDLPTDEFSQRLFESLKEFSSTSERIDDITLTIVDVL
jgi:sigma-B regulation protein RsbU (phosphoserine phosphatase)